MKARRVGGSVLEVRREGHEYFVVVSDTCNASPHVVYDLLADLRSHLEWGGNRLKQSRQRLMSIDAPEGPAVAGVKFSSVGHTSGRAWQDRSTVLQAERPRLFEFETYGLMEDASSGDPVGGHWVHRYEIEPNGTGAKITYRMRARLTMPWYSPPGHHPRYPAVVYNIYLPIIVERGIRSLLAMAEERAGAAVAAEAAERERRANPPGGEDRGGDKPEARPMGIVRP